MLILYPPIMNPSGSGGLIGVGAMLLAAPPAPRGEPSIWRAKYAAPAVAAVSTMRPNAFSRLSDSPRGAGVVAGEAGPYVVPVGPRPRFSKMNMGGDGAWAGRGPPAHTNQLNPPVIWCTSAVTVCAEADAKRTLNWPGMGATVSVICSRKSNRSGNRNCVGSAP